MATMKRPRLTAVLALPDYRLQLSFIDDSVYTVSLADAFVHYPALEPLRDESVFAQAEIIPGEGWTVEWIEPDIQIGADTLWLDAMAQNAQNEAQRRFMGWRAKHGLSLKQAADALGLTVRTVSAYGTGSRPIPKTVLLACKGWEVEQGKLR